MKNNPLFVHFSQLIKERVKNYVCSSVEILIPVLSERLSCQTVP